MSQRTKKPHPSANPKIPDQPPDTPALRDPSLNFSYNISRGETGVLTFEPYKSLILPYWRFRTVCIAQQSSQSLWSIFNSYCQRGDFVGADMTRKFIQMGMTRSKRYANHRGGRKYREDGNVLPKWAEDARYEDEDPGEKRKREEKEEASEIFKQYWRRCLDDAKYLQLKEEWLKGKREYQKRSNAK